MKRVKLFAVPLLIVVSGQTCHLNLLQRPVVIIQASPFPVSLNNWIAKRAAVGCLQALAIEATLVRIVVALRTGGEGSGARAKVRAPMFRVTICTANAGGDMRLNNCRDEEIGVVTTCALRIHIAAERVAVCARVSIRPFRYRWQDGQLVARVTAGQGRRSVGIRIPEDASDRKNTHDHGAPN